MSTFINPKNDYGFKIIFGNESRSELLVSFLNGVLFAGEPIIQSVTILNPYLPGDVQSLKDTYVDIQAVLNDGTIIIIEMQMTLKPDFFKRVLYNVAKKYSNQLDVGYYYRKLKPVVALVVADFIYSSSHPHPLSQFELSEIENSEDYPANKDLQIAVVELPKFRKSLEQLKSLSDVWLYFLRHAGELEEVPSQMSQIEEINTAFEAARRVNLKALELEEIEKREKYAMSEVENLAWARDIAEAAGIEKGLQQGLEKGIEQGIEKGLEKGIEQGIEKGIEQGIETGRIQAIIDILNARYGQLPETIQARLKTLADPQRLQSVTVNAATMPSLDEFIAWLDKSQ